MKIHKPTLKDAIAYKIPENHHFMMIGILANIITTIILKYFEIL